MNKKNDIIQGRGSLAAFQVFCKRFLLPSAMAVSLLFWGTACASDDDDNGELPLSLADISLAEGEEGNWVWVPVPGAICRDGSATGIAVKLSSDSMNQDKLLFYLQGGGACFNDATCATNPSKFGDAEFTTFKSATGVSGVFNETNDLNPFEGWHKVVVPYCTGDIHGGNKSAPVDVPYGLVETLPEPTGQRFVGYRNMQLITRAVSSYFKAANVTEVMLTGSSAGGFGTLVNYDQVKQAFGQDVEVIGLSDAGPLFDDYDPTTDGPLVARDCSYNLVNNLWNTKFPDDYDTYVEDADWEVHNTAGLYSYYSRKYPDQQFGLISHLQDSTIRGFYGINNVTATGAEGLGLTTCTGIAGVDATDPRFPILANIYENTLVALRDIHFAADDRDNWKVYYRGSTTVGEDDAIEMRHTFLLSETRLHCEDGDDNTDDNLPNWINTLRGGTAEHVLSGATASTTGCDEG